MHRALVSVSDKRDLVPFCKQLQEMGWELVSTGGTAALLQEAGIAVTPVEEVTGFPEMLDGRVKTLHPAIHAGLLARRDRPDQMDQLKRLGIRPIDLVVVNLYPFATTIADPKVTLQEAIEQIDIGGPTLLRAAAKNYADLLVLCDPADYAQAAEQLRSGGPNEEQRFRYATKVFQHTAAYDAIIAAYLGEQVRQHASDPQQQIEALFPPQVTLTFERQQLLRYGENPHQRAAFYRDCFPEPNTLSTARQLHGKALSYNNIMDADAAWRLAQSFEKPAAVAVKHSTPCGVGVGESLAEAYQKAYAADPVSIFGGILAFNRVVDREVAKAVHELFIEVVIAPGYDAEALALLSKKKNIRLLEVPSMPAQMAALPTYQTLKVGGGILLQERDDLDLDETKLQVVTRRAPSEAEWTQLRFAWTVVRFVKSNAIVLAKDFQTVGIGGGQMNRVGAAQIAIAQAKELARGSVMASDAFFPMPDTVEVAAQAGITAIIQPGGSIRDADSIEVCDANGIAMLFTGIRHFRHA